MIYEFNIEFSLWYLVQDLSGFIWFSTSDRLQRVERVYRDLKVGLMQESSEIGIHFSR